MYREPRYFFAVQSPITTTEQEAITTRICFTVLDQLISSTKQLFGYTKHGFLQIQT
jgi:hypothetical protein